MRQPISASAIILVSILIAGCAYSSYDLNKPDRYPDSNAARGISMISAGTRVTKLKPHIYEIYARTRYSPLTAPREAAREMWADRANEVCGGDNYVESGVTEYDLKIEGDFYHDAFIDSWQSYKTGVVECLGSEELYNHGSLPVGWDIDSDNADQFRSLIAGNTASGGSENGKTIHENGDTFHIYYAPDGKVFGRVTEGMFHSEYEDSGTWELTAAGQFCETWNRWRNHERICFLTSVLENGKFQMDAIGKPYSDILEIREGDPEGVAAEAGQPIADATGFPEFDLTGVYTSNIRSLNSATYSCFNQIGVFQIDLRQENNSIKGKFLSGTSGGIEGVLVGNKIKFDWYTTKCPEFNDGEWTVSPDGLSLDGYGASELKWKAQKQF